MRKQERVKVIFQKLKDEFAQLITECGFKYVNYKNYTNGVVALHSGLKL